MKVSSTLLFTEPLPVDLEIYQRYVPSKESRIKVFSVKFALRFFEGIENYLSPYLNYKDYCVISLEGNEARVLRVGSKDYCHEICR